MTRETRIGMALMLLLIGVFGAIFYKKWNDRQPTASIAAAAETAAETDEKTRERPRSAAPPAQKEPVENPFAANQHPFESAVPTEPFTRGEAFSEADIPANDTIGDRGPMGEADPLSEPEAGTRVGAPEAIAAADPTTSEVLPHGETVAGSDPFAGMEEPIVSNDDARPFPETLSEPTADFAAAADPDDPFATETQEPAEPATVAENQSVPAEDSVLADPTDRTEQSLLAGEADRHEAAAGPAGAPATTASIEETVNVPVESTSVSDRPASPFEPLPATERPIAGTLPEELNPSGSAVPVSVAHDAGSPRELTFEASDEPARPVVTLGRPESYTVQENDNYWSISKQVYGTSGYFQALAKFNADRIPDPARLKPGMTVLVPPAEQLATRFPRLAPAQAADGRGDSTTPGFHFDAQRRPAYRVGEDDTLSGIAHAHLGRASRWVQIFEMNRDVVQDAKTLKPGTVLRLPADATRVRLVPSR